MPSHKMEDIVNNGSTGLQRNRESGNYFSMVDAIVKMRFHRTATRANFSGEINNISRFYLGIVVPIQQQERRFGSVDKINWL